MAINEKIQKNDSEMTEFLKEQFLNNRELIHKAFRNLNENQYLVVAFYRDGKVRILPVVRNGKQPMIYECITSVMFDPKFHTEDIIDDRIIINAIEERVYRV